MTAWLVAVAVLGPLGFAATLLLIVRVLADLSERFPGPANLPVDNAVRAGTLTQKRPRDDGTSGGMADTKGP